MMMMPEEVVVEIFKRLAAKRLGQIRSVCKSWNSLISSPFFIGEHLQSKPKSYLLLRRGVTCNSYAFYEEEEEEDDLDEEVLRGFRRLRFQCFPFIRTQKSDLQYNHNNLSLMDVIHGVICLTGPNSLVLLWNPRIHKHVHIPFFDDAPKYYCLGFGFNTLKQDFMVMRLWMSSRKPLVYELFSPKQHVWRKGVTHIQLRPGFKVVTKASFFINGNIHWIVSTSCKVQNRLRNCRLLMFDCQREEFTTMKLPRAFSVLFRRDKLIVPRIFNYRGRLSVAISSLLATNVWVMEDYGVSTSWKRLTHFNKDCLIELVSEESLFLMDAVVVDDAQGKGKGNLALLL